MSELKYKEGLSTITKEGYKIIIIKKLKNEKLIVKFECNGVEKLTSNSSFSRGSVLNPYHITVSGIGYIGEGLYSRGSHPKIYHTWRDMIRRCYDEKSLIKHPHYKNCSVSDNWHNFQNYAKWYENNFPKHIEGIKFHVDKDVLNIRDGKRLYSEETCIFLPQRVNNFLTNIKSTNTSGSVGVRKFKDRWVIVSSNFDTSKREHIAVKYDYNEALKSYDEYRELQCEKVKKYLRSLNYLSEEIIQLIK